MSDGQKTYEPVIIGFLCNWCSYRGADLAGTARMKYPPNLRIVRVPCSGRVAPELVLRAFREGADGVLILGCHIGDCHYLSGNHRMVKRMPVLQRLLGYAGIEPERLHWDFVSAAEGERFTQIVSEFTETIRGLPPTRAALAQMDGRLPEGIATRPPYPINVSADGDHAVKGRDDPRWAPLRETMAALLPQVDGVLALRQAHGDVAPHLFQSEAELDDLALWPKYSLPDAARLLFESHPEARIGVVVRGCEERGLVEMAKHRQVDWEKLTLIGLNCSQEEAAACRCANPSTTFAGQVVGDAVPAAEDPLVAGFESLSVEERRALWEHYLNRCIKCYGCRLACPQCFCHACALENPLWVESGQLPPPYPMFHLIKAMHMAGKCVACRECEMSCPAEIPLTILYRLVNRDVAELYNYETGSDLEAMPPLLLTLEGQPA